VFHGSDLAAQSSGVPAALVLELAAELVKIVVYLGLNSAGAGCALHFQKLYPVCFEMHVLQYNRNFPSPGRMGKLEVGAAMTECRWWEVAHMKGSCYVEGTKPMGRHRQDALDHELSSPWQG